MYMCVYMCGKYVYLFGIYKYAYMFTNFLYSLTCHINFLFNQNQNIYTVLQLNEFQSKITKILDNFLMSV